MIKFSLLKSLKIKNTLKRKTGASGIPPKKPFLTTDAFNKTIHFTPKLKTNIKNRNPSVHYAMFQFRYTYGLIPGDNVKKVEEFVVRF